MRNSLIKNLLVLLFLAASLSLELHLYLKQLLIEHERSNFEPSAYHRTELFAVGGFGDCGLPLTLKQSDLTNCKLLKL